MRAALLSSVVAILCGPAVLSGSAQSAAAQQDSTKIVGCLVQGLPPAPGNEQRSEARAAYAKDFFVRTPTMAVPPGTTVMVGKPGTTSTATSAGAPADDSFYRVTGLTAEQLKPHLGHRVELEGHLSDAGADGTVTTARTTVDATGRATTTAETGVLIAGVLHATTIKMVSARCE
jgi:hypothetical protein